MTVNLCATRYYCTAEAERAGLPLLRDGDSPGDMRLSQKSKAGAKEMVCVHVYKCIYVLYVCAYVYMCEYVYACVYMCLYICVCICVFMCGS